MVSFEGQWGEASEKKESTDTVETRGYRTEAQDRIEVSWKRFAPEETLELQEGDSGGAVMFLPGWAMQPDSLSIQELAQAFAQNSHEPTYNVTTRAEKETPDSLYEQAQAIAHFIEDEGLKELTLAGHSQGGDKAIDLVTILQTNNPDIKINGLILLDSVGLHEQSDSELTKNFIKDATINTVGTMARELPQNPGLSVKGIKSAIDILFGIAKDVWKAKLDYLKDKRIQAQVAQMARVNPRMKDVKVPVVLMSGAEDPISNPGKIVPGEGSLEDWKKREDYLRENVFPQSPNVKMVVPEKLGHHGLPLFRSESVARASLYLLDRFKREKKN